MKSSHALSREDPSLYIRLHEQRWGRCMATCLQILKERYRVVFEGKIPNPDEVTRMILIECDEINLNIPPTRTRMIAPANRIWSRTKYGAIKFNCDVSSCKNRRMGGIGVISCNHQQVVVSDLNQRMMSADIETLKERVVLKELCLALKRTWESMEMKSNTSNVIKQICCEVFFRGIQS